LLHFGFARPYKTSKDIADSLSFTADLFASAGRNGIPSIINISSQSVYGQGTKPPWKEGTGLSPESTYAAAKYTSELLLKSVKNNNHINITSLRLAGLAGGQKGLVPIDLLSKFVQQALRGDPIEIRGQHRFERLDVRDAVDGIIKLLSIPSNNWKEVYNLGRGETFSIDELAREIINQVVIKKECKPPQVIVKNIEKSLIFGMDSNAFYQDTNWKPRYSLGETIQSLIEYFDHNQ
jgi:nucleoside-diphosphate-sugar epimerase